MIRKLVVALGLILAISSGLPAQEQKAALTFEEVVNLLKGKGAVPKDQAGAFIAERGIQFELTEEAEKKLRKSGADDELMGTIRHADLERKLGQKVPRVAPEEGKLYQAIQNELDPDKRLQMVNEFETKFPQSNLLTYVCTFAADAYWQKDDIGRVLEYCEKSLKLKEDNLGTLVLMSSLLPEPQALQLNPLDRGKRLSQAETYANRALQLIEQLPAQANETEEQLKKRKASVASGVHATLGMVHLQRAQEGLERAEPEELAKAEQEYKLAVSMSDLPKPPDYYRLGEVYSLDGRTDEAIEAFSKASELAQGTVIQTYADRRVEELKKKKSQAEKAAKP